MSLKERRLAAWALVSGCWRRYQIWQMRRGLQRAYRSLEEIARSAEMARGATTSLWEALKHHKLPLDKSE